MNIKLILAALAAFVISTCAFAEGPDDFGTDAKPVPSSSFKLDHGAPAPHYITGPKGDRGERGLRGRPGRDGKDADSVGIYHEIKSWDAVSKSYVDARDEKIRDDITSGRLTSTAGTTGTTGSGAATTPEGGMNWQSILLIVIAVGTLVGIICYWCGALLFRRRSLMPDGVHGEDKGYDPHATSVNARFSRDLTATHDRLTVEPFDTTVETARETTKQVVSNNALTAQAMMLQASQERLHAVIAGLSGPRQAQAATVNVVLPSGMSGVREDGGRGEAPKTDGPRGYTIPELKELGVIGGNRGGGGQQTRKPDDGDKGKKEEPKK